MLASLEWTPIVVALITSVPAAVAAVLAQLLRRAVRVPSGDKIGAVAERTHALAAVTASGVKMIAEGATVSPLQEWADRHEERDSARFDRQIAELDRIADRFDRGSAAA